MKLLNLLILGLLLSSYGNISLASQECAALFNSQNSDSANLKSWFAFNPQVNLVGRHVTITKVYKHFGKVQNYFDYLGYGLLELTVGGVMGGRGSTPLPKREEAILRVESKNKIQPREAREVSGTVVIQTKNKLVIKEDRADSDSKPAYFVQDIVEGMGYNDRLTWSDKHFFNGDNLARGERLVLILNSEKNLNIDLTAEIDSLRNDTKFLEIMSE